MRQRRFLENRNIDLRLSMKNDSERFSRQIRLSILLLIQVIVYFLSIGKVYKIDEVILYKIAIDRFFTGIGKFERLEWNVY